jgi:hypothetical protein
MDDKFNHVNDFFYTEEYENENDKEPNIMPEKEIKFTTKEFNLFIEKINELYKNINSIELPNNFNNDKSFVISAAVTKSLHATRAGVNELAGMTLLKVKQQG